MLKKSAGMQKHYSVNGAWSAGHKFSGLVVCGTLIFLCPIFSRFYAADNPDAIPVKFHTKKTKKERNGHFFLKNAEIRSCKRHPLWMMMIPEHPGRLKKRRHSSPGEY
jgi:hypothetical protein